MSNKTIALVSAFPPGMQSLNEYGYHLAINFAQNPDVEKVIVIADILDERQAELALGDKIEVRRVWRFNALTTLPKILRAVQSIKPDLVLYNLQTASFGDKEIPSGLGLFTPLGTRIFGHRSGVLAHNMIAGMDLDGTVLKGQRLRQMIVKSGARVVDWGILHANYVTFTLDNYKNLYKSRFPKADITHVPHGTFDTSIQELTPYSDREKLIVTMGKFGTYKRLETLISAIEILRQDPKHSDAKLIIGGTNHPNTPNYLQELEREHAHKPYIHFHGYVAEDDIPEFFSQAKVSVFDYSSTTGSSGVLHQTASYLAVPVFPAIGDFVEVCASEGLRGENYRENDASDMACAIERVLADDIAAAKIGQANREAANEIPMTEIINFHLSKIS